MNKGQTFGTMGLEVDDLCLSDAIDRNGIDELRQWLSEHGVLIFRNQSINEQALIQFSAQFGDLATFHESDKRSATAPEIFRISNVEQDGCMLRRSDDPVANYFTNVTRRWHTDGSYKAIPAFATCLFGVQVPPEGGDTLFADMVAAFEALDATMKANLAGRHMVHNYENNIENTPGHRPMSEADKALFPPVTHPVVRHLDDGRKALYLSDNVARSVGGMAIQEGTALLQTLLQWSTQDRFVYRHVWRQGDVLMWDNRRMMHKATPFDMERHRRVMLRTEIKGERPVF